MRIKVLLSALLLAFAVVGFALWVASSLPSAPAPMAASKPTLETAGAAIPVVLATPSLARRSLTAFVPSRNADALSALDPNSVNGILTDLQKPDREIYEAALQRARGLGDRAIIPRLGEIAASTEDAREKLDILDTIDFLNLPDAAENMAEAAAARAAAGQPDPPQSLTNRWNGRPFVRKQ